MAALAVTTLLLLASACCTENASVLGSRKYPGRGIGIYGGDKVNYTVPYYAMLLSLTDSFLRCQAVIVHKQHLLTTGVCAAEIKKNQYFNYVVEVGTNDYMIPGHLCHIEKIFIHPKFIYENISGEMILDYDIAVIKLKRSLKFTDRVQPIKMADPDFVLKIGDRVVTYGMGETADIVIPLHLRSVSLPYYDHKKCAKTYKKFNFNVTDRFFCAGELGKSGAPGDDGGPVVFHNDTLVGLFSYCFHPELKDLPTGCLNISLVRPFIDSIIKMDE